MCLHGQGGQVDLGGRGHLGVESGDKVAVLVCMLHAYRLTMTEYGKNEHF